MNEFINFSEIYSGVITELAKVTGKKLYGYCEKFITDSIEKNKIDSGDAFIDYLEYSSDRYFKVKTLIYRYEGENLYNFYVPAKVLRKGRREKIDSSNIHNLLDIGNKLIITGTGGIGKTLMLKYLFLETIKNTSYVPVFIELRNLNDFGKDDINLERFIYDELVKFRLKLNQKFFEYSLEIGCYVMLFDGLDELKSEIADVVIKSILDISTKYPDNSYIVSSRPWQGFVGWNNFEELEIMYFEKNQSIEMISKLDYEKSVKDNFIKNFDDSLFKKYESFARTPLLLIMMFLTYKKNSKLPDELNDFYAEAFATLFYEHDKTKNGYNRTIFSKLGYKDFRLIFAYVCFKSYLNDDYEFTENSILEYIEHSKEKNIISRDFQSKDFLLDLNINVCMLIKEGIKYKFSHGSFQEYFAAYYTTKLSDDIQRELLNKRNELSRLHILKSKEIIYPIEPYLEMVFDFQPSKYIKNIVRPLIDELHSLYISNNENPECFIDFWIEAVYVFGEKIAFIVKHSGKYQLLVVLYKYFNYEYQNRYYDTKEKFANNIKDYINNLNKTQSNQQIGLTWVPINVLLNSKVKTDVIRYFDSFIDESLFVLNIIDKNDYSEKTFQDMLDEL